MDVGQAITISWVNILCPVTYTWICIHSLAHTQLCKSHSVSLVHDENLWQGVFEYDSLGQFKSFKTGKT